MRIKKIAFIIQRINYYRIISPLIQKLLDHGIDVDLHHDLSDPMTRRPLEYPSLNWIPCFSGEKQPSVFSFKNTSEFDVQLRGNKPEAVLCLCIPAVCRENLKHWKKLKTKWLFHPAFPDDWVGNLRTKEEFEFFDIFLLQTEFWLESTIVSLRSLYPWFDSSFEIKYRKKIVLVGWPQADNSESIDREKVYFDLGIPPNKKVVVWWNLEEDPFFGAKPNMFLQYRLRERIHYFIKNIRQLKYRISSFFDMHVAQILQETRSFCDSQNACLLLKHRPRKQPLKIEKALADYQFSDISHSPSINHKILSIANLSIGPFSLAARDSVSLKVPYVMYDLGIANLNFYGEQPPLAKKYLESNGLFNYPSLVYQVSTLREFRKALSGSLEEFVVEERHYFDYHKKYIGPNVESQCEHFITKIEERLCRHTARGNKFGL